MSSVVFVDIKSDEVVIGYISAEIRIDCCLDDCIVVVCGYKIKTITMNVCWS